MSSHPDIRILDVTAADTFERLPRCSDPRFDHRSCDYWEDEVRGAKSARPSWWAASPEPAQTPAPRPSDNPFAPPPDAAEGFNPFAPPTRGPSPGGDDALGTPVFNPFAPQPRASSQAAAAAPRKLRLLTRGQGVFGSYAKVALMGDEAVAYAQFGPLSAYPRAQRIRELYPSLPQTPLPAVITCIAATAAGRVQGAASVLVEAVARDLAGRGFAALEAYPDLTLARDEASAADPGFWLGCGFELAVDDDRFPVMRRMLD